MCEKKPGANLPGVVHHKLWCSQLRELVPHTPVHSGRSPRVVVVAQEVDGLAFGQPPAEFLGVVLAAWHDVASIYRNYNGIIVSTPSVQFSVSRK